MAFWPLDTEALLRDTSGNGNHGVLGGNATLVARADGTRAGAYQFFGKKDSFIEFPNNGAYDTRYSITMLMYIYPQGSLGPIFNFQRDALRMNMYGGDSSLIAQFRDRDRSQVDIVDQWDLKLNQWYFVGASYNYNTGMAKLWMMDQVVNQEYIGKMELPTNHEARMGAMGGFFSYSLKAMVTCMQIYDRELTSAEILLAENKCKVGGGVG